MWQVYGAVGNLVALESYCIIRTAEGGCRGSIGFLVIRRALPRKTLQRGTRKYLQAFSRFLRIVIFRCNSKPLSRIGYADRRAQLHA